MTKNPEFSEAALTAARKIECEEDGLYFARYFFKNRFSSKMLINHHHRLIWDTLMKVYEGKINRLIINLPPGYTKTELAVIAFIAWCLAMNPKNKFMHLSYSDDLALLNSTTIREIVKSQKYRSMWELNIKKDVDNKKIWYTEEGGGVYATSAAGQVTGFRAGHIDEGFLGAIIIDDPVKPDDSDREERKKVNERFNSTIKSRLAKPSVPIIVIMQRLHKMDLTGYLLRGEGGYKWHHLSLPALIENKKEKYNKEYTHGIPINYDAKPGPLWEKKENKEELNILKTHKRTWYSQYKQKPEEYILTGGLWEQKIIDKYRITEKEFNRTVVDDLEYFTIALDPSGDDGSEDSGADAIGMITAARSKDGHMYVIRDDSMNGSPAEWGKRAVDVYNYLSCNILVYEKNFGGAMVKNTIATVRDEDKNEIGKAVKCKAVNASRGKLVRAEPISALYEQGMVHHVGYFEELEEELTGYDGKGKSPNRLDALVWAITDLSSKKNLKQSAPKSSYL